MWGAVADRRISRNRWTLGADLDQECFEGVARNVAEARTRLGLEHARLPAGLDGEIRDQNGDVINGPSGDEVSPAISGATLSGNNSFPVLGPAWSTFGNPATRSAPPDAPEPKIPKTKEATEGEGGDLSVTHRHTAGLTDAQVAVALSNEQLLLAGREPARCWPACSTLYLMGDPALAARDPIFAVGNYRDLGPGRGWVTGDPMDPLSRALEVAGAERVGASECSVESHSPSRRTGLSGLGDPR